MNWSAEAIRRHEAAVGPPPEGARAEVAPGPVAPTARATPPPGISPSVWIQTLLKHYGVSQAEVARLTASNESVVSRVIKGSWLPKHHTARGLARQLSIQTTIAELVGHEFEDLWPDAPS